MVDTKLKKVLQAGSFKITTGRVLILSALSAAHKPVSVRSLVKLLKGRIDQATIYRNLLALEKSRIVRKVEMKNDKAYFELKDDQDHHHLICVSCGLIEDFYGCNIEGLAHKALKKSKQFSQVSDHSLELFGLCKSCVRKKL